MKLRILNDTIRFRMNKEEIASLAEENEVTSATHFLTQSLLIHVKTNTTENEIDLISNRIRLSLLIEEVKALHTDESKIGISFTQGELEVRLEKDFKCLTERAEDESKLYENPATSH